MGNDVTRDRDDNIEDDNAGAGFATGAAGLAAGNASGASGGGGGAVGGLGGAILGSEVAREITEDETGNRDLPAGGLDAINPFGRSGRETGDEGVSPRQKEVEADETN
ncbi:MAG: hypothetical protein IVW55_15155 [Chloroflexi bacterium]|nr:hypothetical protein [Chloroflexota bacterium]